MTDQGGASQHDAVPGGEAEAAAGPEPVSGAVDAVVTPWGAGAGDAAFAVTAEQGMPRATGRTGLRYALFGGGALVVVVAAVLIVAVTASGHPAKVAAASAAISSTATAGPGGGAAATAAPSASSPDDAASPSAVAASGPAPSPATCVAALQDIANTLSGLGNDVTDATKISAAVQKTVGELNQLAASSSSPGFKSSLSQTSTDLRSLETAAAQGDIDGETAAFTALGNDAKVIASACGLPSAQ